MGFGDEISYDAPLHERYHPQLPHPRPQTRHPRPLTDPLSGAPTSLVQPVPAR